MNITGAFSLLFGAIFSAYVFMPKRRLLPYSLDPDQPFDHFLFNLLIGADRDPGQLRRVAPGALRDAPGQTRQPRPGHDPDRRRGVRRDCSVIA